MKVVTHIPICRKEVSSSAHQRCRRSKMQVRSRGSAKETREEAILRWLLCQNAAGRHKSSAMGNERGRGAL
jgi:hypothetical protein